MSETFFLHQIKTKIVDGNKTWDKGIVIHDTFEDAKQGYHAYLGAYAYGRNPECDYVQCMITDKRGDIVSSFSETWYAPVTES